MSVIAPPQPELTFVDAPNPPSEPGAAPESKHTDGTHRLAVWRWEPSRPATRTVVCLHGLTRNARDFDYLAARLVAEGARVLCPDAPGRGASAPLRTPEWYHNGTYAQDMLHWLKTEKLSGVDWVGTSMGGLVAMLMLAHDPHCIRRLVLNDIGALVPGAALARIARYVALPATFPDRAAAEAELRRRLAPFGIREEAHWKHMFRHSITESGGTVRLAYDPAIAILLGQYAPSPETEAAPPPPDIDLQALWALLPCPILLLRGALSDVLPADVATRMATTERPAPTTLHTFPDVGHAPALMEAEQISVIQAWLQSSAR